MNGGIDRVQLVEYATVSDARFAAIEAHDEFWGETAATQNRAYVISLARKRIKRFAATSGKTNVVPFISIDLRPTKVLEPLITVDEQEAQLNEIMEHKKRRAKV